MTTKIEAGRIRVLFRTGSYDGMMSGIGLLDGKPVFLDAGNFPGGWQLKPKWRQFEDLMDELLDDEDAENIWDRLERKYDDQMNESTPRRFEVRTMSNEEFENALERHRQFQLHVGLHCDFQYDEKGCPRYPHDKYWGKGPEYIKAHYHDVVSPREKITGDLLGIVDYKNLFAPSDHRPAFPSDPRSDALKRYQRTWKEGDPVRLDW